MEVNALKPGAVNPDYGVSGAAEKPKMTTPQAKAQPKEDKPQKPDTGAQGTSLSQEEMRELTAALNKFFSSLNADLQFSIHEKTNSLMVQMVDPKKQQVIKEFPQHEFLDMVARIREYVGALLDKKA